ncbi:hypothetical protein SAMN04487948_1097 [Halogranum amylolyticum]|uniref:Uncharacterized protein n=1 Tax=Halogranum amylolyticum TaxID=660520 RepID=A0A1H8TYX1_9EURY|nr:hypothetical protein [Halogranum amylolyticum]SEO96097.1 hypothetical protein SAMN04487948_1097 [Halogranum amylolyticum]
MWADVLTVVGLVFDMFGAILLIGIDWRVTLKFGKTLKPRFKRLDSIIDQLGNFPYEDAEPGDEGFDDLFEVLSIEPTIAPVPAQTWERNRIEAPTEKHGKARFVFVRADTEPNVNMDESANMRMDTVENLANRYVERWFTRWGVRLLVVGFGLQILSTALPYLSV